ncbi:cyanophycin synthetase [Leptolyngbya sp. FACHB-261]|uniref:ATP-binding protein n=1 Tax=Leptolyngbya sp. FACHB-261 TaxID=2692806 RepID=UPI001688F277|nr:cyanophycin synthetase [Leptolyngbya sp. FACHB-261]MBD2104447.1 cyanophycin synthetase [Leptolyngbya sp. FACHB-261]
MGRERSTIVPRVNARKTDAFDIFNFKHYVGPNANLGTAALVFDFVTTEANQPRPLEDYVERLSERYPHLSHKTQSSYGHLFAQVIADVRKCDLDLYQDHCNVVVGESYTRIAVQSLHARTDRAVVYLVWDWFEAITQGEDFRIEDRLQELKTTFRQSVYGGPTVYALWRTAYEKGIPTFYLWDEGLVQYGYGRKQVRGIATTFDQDSHLDSDFTTRKDDCKAFLSTLGFPVPKGEIVVTLNEALSAARAVGYPVAVKPVVGHKGIGVTADVRDPDALEFAFERAVEAIGEDQARQIIVEQSISGSDFRLLCVNGGFVAATERRAASVVGDGYSTLSELIERENRRSARQDTPTSPLGKIHSDESMHRYLSEQGLTLDSVIEEDRTVYLRKVANLSAGGMSIDATHTVHPDNIILAQDIAQHLRLTCLGIDVIARDLSHSWRDGDFGILEINAAPGVFMHLKPAVGESVDVTSPILSTFFASGREARIPIITFNRVTIQELQEVVDHILFEHPDWTIGAVCREAVLLNRSEKAINSHYNSNIQNLLRNPRLDLLIAEYSEESLNDEGMFYQGSNLIVLNNPTEAERTTLMRDAFEDATTIIKEGDTISIRRKGLMEQYRLGPTEPFLRVYQKELATIL